VRSLFKLARGGQVYQTEKNVGQKGPQDGGLECRKQYVDMA